MPIIDLYEHGEQRKNLAHFATLASLAVVDGIITDQEKAILDKFAFQLNISDADYKEVMKEDNKYPIETPASKEKRLMRLFDFFKISFADCIVDEDQMGLIKKYALGLGFAADEADSIIKRSHDIFNGKIAFEDYQYLLNK